MADVEIAFATPECQVIVRVTLEPEMNARQAVMRADLPARHAAWADFDFALAPLGIFGERLREPEVYLPTEGERIEVYRPLEIDPKQARRERAATASSR
ncbi:RnfH family protein [Salinicola halimionae]|uniref:RnfH family protein n=1 Tax=Salinicola halimionae TaxID=1949081 RepID=UPI000DA24AFE|nr:RnfH family protein [Salinicola halimionae]